MNCETQPAPAKTAEELVAYVKNPDPANAEKRGAYSLGEMRGLAESYLTVLRTSVRVATGFAFSCNFCVSQSIDVPKDLAQMGGVTTEFATLPMFFDDLQQFFAASPVNDAGRMMRSINTPRDQTVLQSSSDQLMFSHRFSIMLLFLDDFLFCTNGQIALVFKAQIAVEEDYFSRNIHAALRLVEDFEAQHGCVVAEKAEFFKKFANDATHILTRACVAREDSQERDAQDVLNNRPKRGVAYTIVRRPCNDGKHTWIELRSERATLLNQECYWIMLPEAALLDMPLLTHANVTPNLSME